jgi:hypothetical protein
VHVDPIKPTLKAPGNKLLKVKCDKPLSKFAFKINLRRYNVEHGVDDMRPAVRSRTSSTLHRHVTESHFKPSIRELKGFL